MGRQGGMAEGVAHAPDASFAFADSCADCETGGTKRRPMYRCEITRWQGHAASRIHVTCRPSIVFERPPRATEGGTLLPRLCSPLLFFAFVDLEGVQGARTRLVSSLLTSFPDACRSRVNDERGVNVRGYSSSEFRPAAITAWSS